jgi:hypothetical protein
MLPFIDEKLLLSATKTVENSCAVKRNYVFVIMFH